MTHPLKPNRQANVWSDIHRARPDEAAQLAYYRYVARRLRGTASRRLLGGA